MNDDSFGDVLGILGVTIAIYVLVTALAAAPLFMLIVGALSTADGLQWIPAIGYGSAFGMILAVGLVTLPGWIIKTL